MKTQLLVQQKKLSYKEKEDKVMVKIQAKKEREP